MSFTELNSNMELEEVITNKSDGNTSSMEHKNMLYEDNMANNNNIRILRSSSNFWKCLKSNFINAILVIVVIVLIIVVILLIFMYQQRLLTQQIYNQQIIQYNESFTKNRCTSKPCLQAALSILNSVNFNVNPCDDFKEYACGLWEQNIFLPPGTNRISPFDEIQDKVFNILRMLINAFDMDDSTDAERKMKRFYQSCIDTESINKRGVQPFIDFVTETYGKYGGWQLVPSTQPNQLQPFDYRKWSMKQVVENINSADLLIVGFTVSDDAKNNSIKQLYITPRDTILEKELLLKKDNKELLSRYQTMMKNMLKLFNANISQKLMNDIFHVELQFAKNYPSSSDTRNVEENYHIYSLENIHKKICPMFNWSRILEVRQINYSNPQLKIIIQFPEMFKANCRFLQRYLSDPKNNTIIHNVMMWRLLIRNSGALSDDVRRVEDQFQNYLNGITGVEPRWKECVKNTLAFMHSILGNIFIRKYFHAQTRPKVMEMIRLLRNQFRRNIQNYEWIDDETKNYAVLKLNKMQAFIGYTPEILNKNRTNNVFANITINETLFFENLLELQKRRYIMNKKAGYPSENSTLDTPLTVNAFYKPTKNEISFPVGILQPPFFDSGVPRSLNYGGIGTAIGHEMGHGFDDKGSLYDSNGNINNWRSNFTKRNFDDRAQCFLDQYSSYKLSNQTLNSKNSLGEDIADNGGVRLSYQVFKQLQKTSKPEQLLPGIELNHDQLFFVAFARLWCNVETKEYLEQAIRNDPHTPNKYRIIGVLSNMEEFSETFKCPPGSNMNPSKKCKLW